MKIISLFSGAGGLDRGFEAAGFQTLWANEYDKDIWQTFEKNFPRTILDRRSIRDVPSEDIPEAVGIIGGPPCQSWSEAGALRGIEDARGQLFFEFIRVLRDKKPLFFLAENVSGMLAKRHASALETILQLFRDSGYQVSMQLVNAAHYGVAQDRKRVFFVGLREDLQQTYMFPEPLRQRKVLRDSIADLQHNAVAFAEAVPEIPNHEYMMGGFSSIYMSRNRVRAWDEPSFTIQAGGRHAPIHPQAPKMLFVEKDKRIFVPEKAHLYRRLSVRECARIQSFPDSHIFYYRNIAAGYKMVGNAVPCNLAYVLAKQLKQQLQAVMPVEQAA